MARHAGFGTVATITEEVINHVAATYVRELLGPFFFPLPQTINVGVTAITFGGIVEMLAPRIELHANPLNLVRVHFSFRSTLRAQFSGQPMRTWAVQLDGTVDAGLITSIRNNQVVLGINTTQVVFQPFAVQVLQGPQIPGPILAALQSQALAGAITGFVQSIPPLTISPPMLKATYSIAQPSPPGAMISEFEWFRVDLTASRIVAKPLEQAITLAIDFAGFTQGDPNQLVDLTRVGGSGTIYVDPIIFEKEHGFVLVGQSEPSGGSIASAINMDLIAKMIGMISAQISGTFVTKQLRINSLSAGYARFDKALRGNEDALDVNFTATVWISGVPDINVDGRFLVLPYLRTYDGQTDFIRSDTWHIYVAQVEIILPLWVEVALFVFQVLCVAVGPVLVLAQAFAFVRNVLSLEDFQKFQNSIVGPAQNSASSAQQLLQGSVDGVRFPAPWSEPLPGLAKPDWDGQIRYVSVTPESIDMAMSIWSWALDQPTGVISPQSWPASNREPFFVRLKLRDDFERLAPNNLMLNWEVRRADTNQVVVTGVEFYFDLGGNGVWIPHHSPELYLVDAFIVRCSATMTLGSQVGEIWSGQQTIPITDRFNRHHKFVYWGPHIVHFMNAGTKKTWWSKVRRSRIHRTAISARCRELRRSKYTPKYFDTLPFAWEDLNRHRKPLCEYCFFGGPDKFVPFPEEDW